MSDIVPTATPRSATNWLEIVCTYFTFHIEHVLQHTVNHGNHYAMHTCANYLCIVHFSSAEEVWDPVVFLFGSATVLFIKVSQFRFLRLEGSPIGACFSLPWMRVETDPIVTNGCIRILSLSISVQSQK